MFQIKHKIIIFLPAPNFQINLMLFLNIWLLADQKSIFFWEKRKFLKSSEIWVVEHSEYSNIRKSLLPPELRGREMKELTLQVGSGTV